MDWPSALFWQGCFRKSTLDSLWGAFVSDTVFVARCISGGTAANLTDRLATHYVGFGLACSGLGCKDGLQSDDSSHRSW